MAAPIYVGGIALPATDSIALDASDDGPFIVDRTGPIWQTLDDLKNLLPAVLKGGSSALRDAWLQTWGVGFLNAQARAGFVLEAQHTARFAEGIWLDAWGDLLGKPRATGEDDQSYRARLLTGIDMVTPTAIKTAVEAVLEVHGVLNVIYNEPPVDMAFAGPATTSDPLRPNSLHQTIANLQTWAAFSQPQVPLSGLPTPNQSVYLGKNLRFWANYTGVTGNSPIGAFAAPLGPGFWIIAQDDLSNDDSVPRSEPLSFTTSPGTKLGLIDPDDYVGSLAALFGSSIPTPMTAVAVGSDLVYQRPYKAPPGATTVTLSMANRNYAGGVASFVSNVAAFASDGSGLATGSPLGIWPAQVIPGDGTVKTIGSFPVTLGSDGKYVIVHSVPNGTNVASSLTPITYGSYTSGTLTVNPPPAPTGTDVGPVLDIHLKYPTTAARRVVVFGDSISVGYNAAFETSSYYKLIGDRSWAVEVIGVVQYGSLQNFANFGGLPALWDTAAPFLPGADLVVQVCVNDLAYNDLSIMQSSAQTIVTHARTFNPARILFLNCGPQAGYPGTEPVRTGYNAWLPTQVGAGMNIDGVIDIAASQASGGIADNVTPSLIYGPYDSGDGTHPNAAGQAQISTRVFNALNTFPASAGGSGLTGFVSPGYDSVVDQINVEVSRRRAAGVPWMLIVDLPRSNAI